MRSISSWIVALAASPLGVTVLAFVDSTPLFALPGGIDAAVLLASARGPKTAWLTLVLATLGSLAGAVCTFWMGEKVGEHGLERYVPAKRLARVRAKVRSAGALQLALLDLIPPPFPFTPFVLAAGALEVDAFTFFRTLAVCRLLRFGLEAWLAAVYGSGMTAWLESDALRTFVVLGGLIAVVLSVFSLFQLVKSSRTPSQRPATS